MDDYTRPGDRMLRVLGMRDLTHREARVLACIAFHDGPPDGACPSLDRIADECGMLRGRVAETIAALCRSGRLVRVPGKGRGRGQGRKSNRYHVIYSDPETRDGVTALQRPGNRALQRPGNPGREPEGAGRRGSEGEMDLDPLWKCRAGGGCSWIGSDRETCPLCGCE